METHMVQLMLTDGLWATFEAGCQARGYRPTDKLERLIARCVSLWEPELMRARIQQEAVAHDAAPHQPAGEPCACLPGTAGWAKHHGSPGGTLPEAFDEAMESFTDDAKEEGR